MKNGQASGESLKPSSKSTYYRRELAREVSRDRLAFAPKHSAAISANPRPPLGFKAFAERPQRNSAGIAEKTKPEREHLESVPKLSRVVQAGGDAVDGGA